MILDSFQNINHFMDYYVENLMTYMLFLNDFLIVFQARLFKLPIQRTNEFSFSLEQ